MIAAAQGQVLVLETDEKVRTLATLVVEGDLLRPVVAVESIAALARSELSIADFEFVVVGLPLEGTKQEQERFFESLSAGGGRPVVLMVEGPPVPPQGGPRPERLAILRKPFTPDQMLSAFELLAAKPSESADAALFDDERPFCPIRVSSLPGIGPSYFDVYVRISEHRYVKVLKQGDPFSLEDRDRYLAKGVEYLYLRREDYSKYLESLTERIVQEAGEEEVHFDSAYRVSARALQLIQDTALMLGVTPEVSKLTQAAVKKTMAVIRKNPALFQLFSRIAAQKGSYIVDHSILLAHVSCGVASLQPWVSKTTHFQLTLASFLHDITLVNPALARIQTYENFVPARGQFTEDEVEAFLGHPQAAADLIRRLRGFPPGADEIVQQHHERPDGTGFPNNLDHGSIRPLVCAFIVAHELVGFLHDGGAAGELPRLLFDLKKIYRAGHFKTVLESLALALARNAIA
jgi:hypothetical protein